MDQVSQIPEIITSAIDISPFVSQLSLFVLSIFVGYFVVWSVTPALHTPLMAVTNAISSVIIVGALIAAGPSDMNSAKILGILAIGLAAVNIFGGFAVTNRMLAMYKKKPKTTKTPKTTTPTTAPFSPSFESHRLRKPTGGLISPSWDPLALTQAALPSDRRTQATTQATKSALDNGCLPQLSY